MCKYTTLLFDSDDTLLDFNAAEAGALEEALQSVGITFTPENHHLYSNINREFWQAHERGEIERSEIFIGRFKRFLQIIGSDIEVGLLAKAYEERLACHHPLMQKAVETIELLYGKYKLYIVTNGMKRVQEKRLKESGLTEFFDGVFISEELGVPKPEKEFFDKVFENIEEKDKGKILIIGDSMTSDILGGIKAGIDTCWLNPKNKEAAYYPTYQIKDLEQLQKMLV